MALDVKKGLQPSKKRGGYNAAQGTHYPIANGYGSEIGYGDPVKLSAGVVQLATNGERILGSFLGVQYANTDSQVVYSRNFPTGTSSKGGVEVAEGYTQPLAFINDDPDQVYVMRTVDAASVSAGMLGQRFLLSAIGSVQAHSGNSQCVLDVAASVGASTTADVRVVGLWTGRDNEWGDAPTAVEVVLVNPGFIGGDNPIGG